MFDIFKIEKLKHLSFKHKTWLSIYPWYNCKPIQKAHLSKSFSDLNVAIVSSAGLYIKNKHKKFDNSIKGGDWSFRIIPSNVNMELLLDGHRSNSYDHSGLKLDPSIGMPIQQLEDLVSDGFIGSLNQRQISFMGSLLAPRKFIKYSIPKIVEILLEDNVDCTLMIPV